MTKQKKKNEVIRNKYFKVYSILCLLTEVEPHTNVIKYKKVTQVGYMLAE